MLHNLIGVPIRFWAVRQESASAATSSERNKEWMMPPGGGGGGNKRQQIREAAAGAMIPFAIDQHRMRSHLDAGK